MNHRLIALLLLLPVLGVLKVTHGLDNGLARTPPMGWLSWERFRCNTDCKNDPDHCISEWLFKSQAELMVKKGYLKAGYEYIIIDDCWLNSTRDEQGKLQPDKDRFPSGIKALADHIHGLGLKFGIYEDYGTYTCGGYPGVLGHLETDANTFAEWEVDYVKLDGCYADIHDMDHGYPEFGSYLNKTNRPMVYSCSWPAYQVFEGMIPDYSSIAKFCNLWRNYGDIQDSWSSLADIINFYADDKGNFSTYAAPGSWNDPDMLLIGNFGLSLDQAMAQMALWSIFASPLIMSVDLRTIRPEFEAILLNKNAIKINQDPLGIQGRRVFHDKDGKIDIFVRPLTKSGRISDNPDSAAVAVLYLGDDGTPRRVSFTPASLGLNNPSGYSVMEVFQGTSLGHFGPSQEMVVFPNPSGVVFLRFDGKPQLDDDWMNDVMTQFLMHNDDDVSSQDVGKSGWIYHEES